MKIVGEEKPAMKPAALPAVTSQSLSVVIYTSGTTGNPKGVELSHENICSNLKGLKALWKDSLYCNRSLAFLPWAHVYGQVRWEQTRPWYAYWVLTKYPYVLLFIERLLSCIRWSRVGLRWASSATGTSFSRAWTSSSQRWCWVYQHCSTGEHQCGIICNTHRDAHRLCNMLCSECMIVS